MVCRPIIVGVDGDFRGVCGSFKGYSVVVKNVGESGCSFHAELRDESGKTLCKSESRHVAPGEVVVIPPGECLVRLNFSSGGYWFVIVNDNTNVVVDKRRYYFTVYGNGRYSVSMYRYGFKRAYDSIVFVALTRSIDCCTLASLEVFSSDGKKLSHSPVKLVCSNSMTRLYASVPMPKNSGFYKYYLRILNTDTGRYDDEATVVVPVISRARTGSGGGSSVFSVLPVWIAILGLIAGRR